MLTHTQQRSADQMATTYQMGHLIQEYKAKKGIGIASISIGMLLLTLTLTAYLSGKHRSSFEAALFLLTLLGFLLIIIGGLVTLAQSRYSSARMYIYTYGLIYIYRDKLMVLRWPAIQEIWLNISVSRYRSEASYRLSSYTLRQANGQQLILSSSIWHLHDVGSLIEQYMVQEQLPKALDSYRIGRPLPFGPITLEHEGITLTTSHGPTLLPWDQITHIAVLDQGISINVREQQDPYQVSSASIPNLCVFLALMHTLRSGQDLQTEKRYNWLNT